MSRRSKNIDLHTLEGVITFFGSHHAIRAEGLLRRHEISGVLIPGPREISPNCGVAIRFDFNRKEEVRALLQQHMVHFEDMHHYPEA
jgi:hypothetical protein